MSAMYLCIYVSIFVFPFPPVCCLCLTNKSLFISLETSSDQSGQIFHLEEASEQG